MTELPLLTIAAIMALFIIVAFLYSSVGHGGASGYLAVLSFFAFHPAEMASTALILNLIVAGTATISFMRKKHFSWELAWPFVVTSVPASFLGGMIRISAQSYTVLLAVVLLLAAGRLVLNLRSADSADVPLRIPSRWIAMLIGGGIGLLSGVVGVGGGIFLSPLIMLMGWANAKTTAAISAVFILVNSLAGLGGRAVGSTLAVGSLLPFIAAAFVGGYLGSHFGSSKYSNLALRRLLALVLVIASVKLVISAL